MKTDKVVEKVMEKKPYSFVNKNFIKKISKLIKAKDDKEKLKLIRAKLRKVSCSALPLKFYKKFQTMEFSKALEMHRSTRERASLYPWLIDEIGTGKKIVDLGCGLNLIAFHNNNFIPKEYIGYDIDCAVINFLERFSKEKKLNAKAFCDDISELKFQDCDVCLCLKLFDALEDVEWGIAEKIMKKIVGKAKKIIVSFSNVSLGGRKQLRERDWFEKILKKLKLNFKKENKGNETFYIIG